VGAFLASGTRKILLFSARHFHIAVGAIGYRRADFFCNQVTLFCVAQRLNQLTLEELVSVMAKGLRRLALPASAEKASPLTGLTAHLNFGPLDKEANWVGAMKARQVIDGARTGDHLGRAVPHRGLGW
jgi:hypothetical protein